LLLKLIVSLLHNHRREKDDDNLVRLLTC